MCILSSQYSAVLSTSKNKKSTNKATEDVQLSKHFHDIASLKLTTDIVKSLKAKSKSSGDGSIGVVCLDKMVRAILVAKVPT